MVGSGRSEFEVGDDDVAQRERGGATAAQPLPCVRVVTAQPTGSLPPATAAATTSSGSRNGATPDGSARVGPRLATVTASAVANASPPSAGAPHRIHHVGRSWAVRSGAR